MYNASEEQTVKARHRHARAIAGLVVGTLLGGSAATLGAQTQQPLQRGQTPGPRFMVPTFKSTERNLGVQFAEALRERMGGDYQIREIWIVPKTDITNTLEASGYSTTEALNPNDTRTLGTQVRAAEYVEGTVSKTPAGYKVETNLLLIRGEGMVQPLPVVEGAKLGDLARDISKHIDAARKQIPAAQKCMELARAKNYAGALAEARKGVTAYARATMPRVCMAEIYAEQKLGADSMMKISEEILAIHPTNRRALAFAADAYNEKKMDEKYISALTTLLSEDPNNTRLQETVVNALANSGKPEIAKPIIDRAVALNPGDPSLLRLQWRLYLALKEYKGALAIGEELVKTDTAFADTTYFTRMAAAAMADSQPQVAAQLASRGVAKFPNNDALAVIQVQLLRQSGQTQQALEAANKIIARNPKTAGINLQKAQIQVELKAPAQEILATLKAAADAGDDKSTVAQYALTLGNQAYRGEVASKTAEDYRTAIKYVTFSDETAPTDNAKLLLAAANLQLAVKLANDAREQKSCDLAKEGSAAVGNTQMLLAAVGKSNPEQARALAGGVQQLMPYYDQVTKALCK
jgi:hypothetical protein